MSMDSIFSEMSGKISALRFKRCADAQLGFVEGSILKLLPTGFSKQLLMVEKGVRNEGSHHS